MNRKKTEADRKLLKLLESDGDEAVLGEEFKSELVKQIMIKSVESDEYCASGRALCTQCKTLLSATDGGHVFRHLDRCTSKRAASEPIPEKSDESLRSVEPLAKQRKLTGTRNKRYIFSNIGSDFSKRQFTKEQTSKITRALAKHALRTGKSFNYMGGDCMRDLVIDVANATGSGIFGKEAKAQIPHRQTIQTHTLKFSDELIKRAFGELKPYAGKQRVNLIVDHGKIVSNYLSMFASYIDDTFKLRLLPIGFIPSADSKTGADTADAIIDRFNQLADIRCVSHSIHLLGEKVVDPLEKHAKTLDPEIMKLLPIARECLDNAQNVSSAIRNNFQACSEMSRLPTLPNDTRWLNGLKCLVDVTELSKEILDLVSKLSLKGRTSMYWLNDHPEHVNAVLHILKPLLTYSIDFQPILIPLRLDVPSCHIILTISQFF
ncbi:Protein CBG20107 [Caenorhabditis briggsae]|uniref:Protein CBG20107 n=1 Tax=Caenorhabditis briggsae TaxID=6238 RepID=A8XX39_CAEBR|nr:Protein CBG20107 [Caenorhabditis briggsae]CAP37208.2 Protein CBG20107 [Caenorhabditis briggsae]